MIYVVLSGISGAVIGLSARYRSTGRFDPFWILFIAAIFSVGLSALGLVTIGGEVVDRPALFLGFSHGLTITISTALFFFITDRARIGVSWTVVQLGVIVPFLFSITVMGETLSTVGITAIACATVAVVLFGKGHSSNHNAPRPTAETTNSIVRHTGATLFIASLFSGITQIFPRVYTEYGRPNGLPLIFWSSVSMVVYSSLLLLLPYRREGYRRPAQSIARYLGFSAIFSTARFFLVFFLLMALPTIPGAIAFPVRSVVNTGSVVIVAALAYRENVSRAEWIAIAFSTIAVALIAGG